jgi:hypothetical protein
MFRIYDTPRYKNQSFYRVLIHIDLHAEEESSTIARDLILANCGNESLRNLTSSAYAYHLGEYKLFDSEPLEPLGDGFEESDVLYHKYSYEQGTLRQNPNDFQQVMATGKAISEILVNSIPNEEGVSRKIWFDSDACFRLVHGYVSGKFVATFSDKDLRRRTWANSLAKDIASVSMAACRLGANSVDSSLSNFHHFSETAFLSKDKIKRKPAKCQICGKLGHINKNCWFKDKDKADNKNHNLLW